MLQLPRKMKSIPVSDYSYKYIPGTHQREFSDKIAPDIDGYTNKLMWCLSCKNNFAHDSN